MKPIGVAHSCFKEKFGAPRQPGLLKHSIGTIELYPPFNNPESVQELESFSHIWLIFSFHLIVEKQNWSPTVRPPRLGGNKRVGVFASRSPFRPNNLGLSVVRLHEIEKKNQKIILHISGQDLVEGTPILDIKPYLPSVDSLDNAKGGWTDQLDPTSSEIKIDYSEEAISFLEQHSKGANHLKELITEILKQDPRPAYYKEKRNQNKKTNFSILLYDFDIHFDVSEKEVFVTSIEAVKPNE